MAHYHSAKQIRALKERAKGKGISWPPPVERELPAETQRSILDLICEAKAKRAQKATERQMAKEEKPKPPQPAEDDELSKRLKAALEEASAPPEPAATPSAPPPQPAPAAPPAPPAAEAGAAAKPAAAP